MTWVVGARCCDGLVCVADVQVTVTLPTGQKVYFDCLQKVHQIYDNLICAFSGDVKVAFHIIEELKVHLEKCLRANGHIFDLDGELDEFRAYLQMLYSRYSKKGKENVEFLFLWSAPEEELEDGISPCEYYCWKFRSPDFKQSGAGELQKTVQSGCGVTEKEYSPVISFLEGKPGIGKQYRELLGINDDAFAMVTAKRFRKILMKEAQKVDSPGISKFFCGYEGVMDTRTMHDRDAIEEAMELFREAGFVKPVEDGGLLFDLDIAEIVNGFPSLDESTRTRLAMVMLRLQETRNNSPYYKYLEFNFFNNFEDSEALDSPHLISTWNELRVFLKDQGVNIASANAVA